MKAVHIFVGVKLTRAVKYCLSRLSQICLSKVLRFSPLSNLLQIELMPADLSGWFRTSFYFFKTFLLIIFSAQSMQDYLKDNS